MADGREAVHSARKNALANQLLSMLGDGTDAFVLLCLGKEYESSIIPVPISYSADETVIWRLDKPGLLEEVGEDMSLSLASIAST